MNELIQKNKKIIIFAGVLILVFTVYSLFIKKAPKGDLTTEKAPAAVQAASDNKDLLNQLQSLNSITLQSDIFTSSLFNRLQDNTVIIENRKPEGRKNPFLPIGFDAGIFTPDSSIVNATVNTNGLLNQTSGTSTQNLNISPTNIKSTVPSTSTSTKTGTAGTSTAIIR